MQLVIHRGAYQVGGSCLELSCMGSTILLDIGLPLDSSFDHDPESCLPQPLFDEIRQGIKKIHGVLLSHAHMDHYGLAGMLPQDIPLFCGRATSDLINMSFKMNPQNTRSIVPQLFQDRKPFNIGPFTITPYLMDHSAFDSYAFLIASNGKNLFYTGDFRAHGRKMKSFYYLINNPPDVDVLVMEGTMVGPRSDDLTLTEGELEEKFVQLIEETPGIVLISTSSQNIDRLVTIFKAAKRTNRRFIIDFYTAEILEQLGKYANIPQASWHRIKVCYPRRLSMRFKRLGLQEVLERHHKNRIRWTRLQEIEDRAVMLIRPNFLEDIEKYLSLNGSTWIYSMWSGYLDRSTPLKNLKTYLEENGVRIEYLHTGGHAKIGDLKKMTEAFKPSTVIPVHSFHSEKFKDLFDNVQTVEDGEVFRIN